MAKTVLQYVQNALSLMSSDAVDSINDTEEAIQVATMLGDIYLTLMNREEWRFLDQAINPVAAGDTASPTKFTIQNATKFIYSIAYNVDTQGGVRYRDVIWVDPAEFMRRQAYLASASTRLLVTHGSQLQFYVATDRMPTIYTSFDDVVFYCDAYDSSIDTTLVSSKMSGFGAIIPTYSASDNFVPYLPEQMVMLLQHQLNAFASATLKQLADAESSSSARTMMAQARRAHSKTGRKHYLHNKFGRNNNGSSYQSVRHQSDFQS